MGAFWKSNSLREEKLIAAHKQIGVFLFYFRQ
jgi:hypothetical protein